MSRLVLGWALLGLGLMASTGCGPSRGEVSGTVTISGQPLNNGVITFFPPVGSADAPVAVHITDGKYLAPSLVYATYRIAITPQVAEGGEAGQAKGSSRPLKPGEIDPNGGRPSGGLPKALGTNVRIPEKLRSPDTSELSVKVDQAKVEHSIKVD